jgi:DNA-binding winged helix-turn-helix (wHTH) protein
MVQPHLAFGPFSFDPNSRVLWRGGSELSLPPRVIAVLEVLLRRAGDVVPRQELIDSVWKDAFVTDTSLAEAVSSLRQALGDDPQTPVYVQTLHRRGYRFVAPITETTRERPGAAIQPAAAATAEAEGTSFGGPMGNGRWSPAPAAPRRCGPPTERPCTTGISRN